MKLSILKVVAPSACSVLARSVIIPSWEYFRGCDNQVCMAARTCGNASPMAVIARKVVVRPSRRTTSAAISTALATPAVATGAAKATVVEATQSAPAVLLDLDRVELRLDSLNSYAVVSALLLATTLRLYSGHHKEVEEGGTNEWSIENIARLLFIFSSGISVVAGAYTTVVFSLLGLYSKSALGMAKDQSFLQFFEVTAPCRGRAFRAFLVALLSLEACFISSLFLDYDGKVRWAVVTAAIVVALISWNHWQSIIHLASSLLRSS